VIPSLKSDVHPRYKRTSGPRRPDHASGVLRTFGGRFAGPIRLGDNRSVSADIKLPQFRRFCSREGRSWADDGHTNPSARLPASGARLLFELGLRGQQPIVYPPVPSAGTRAMEHTTCLASGQIHPISECSLSAAWPSPLGFPSRTSRASSRAADERGAGCRSLAS